MVRGRRVREIEILKDEGVIMVMMKLFEGVDKVDGRGR